MEFGQILDQIRQRFLEEELYELIVKLDEAPRGAATGTEGMALIGGFLLRLKETDTNAFNKIKDLVDEYVKLCAKYGLTLRLQ